MRCILLAVVSAALAGCAVGPDYSRPKLELPASYREAGPWKLAEPQLADFHQPWWEMFGDPDLNRLEVQATSDNFTIAQLAANYRAAQALVAAARSGFFPDVGVNASGGRSRSHTSTGTVLVGNSLALGATASWEPDLWGSVRRSVEAASAGAQASADDLAGARLSVQSQLAIDYLTLRVVDVERDLFADTTAAYAKALQLAQSQYRAGVALRSDVALAESTLEAARAQATDLDGTRALLEHAIGTLTGQPASNFSLSHRTMTLEQLRDSVPPIPVGVPSDLLQRRPDIAAAERLAAQANANIGVAQAAFFPSLVLTGSGGFTGSSLVNLFDVPGRVWSLGAALAGTVFDGGLRTAHVDQARAQYDSAAANYKQTVLSGLQEVEDNLSTLRVLDTEGTQQKAAVVAAQVAETSALRQYRAGTAPYLAVITAQNLSLSNQRLAAQIVGRELAAAVSLVTGVGGGWTTDTPVAQGAAQPAVAATH